MKKVSSLYLFFLALLAASCSQNVKTQQAKVSCFDNKYAAKNVILVVIDGPRMSETWGDPDHRYIPYLSNVLRDSVVIGSSFYNWGDTYTVPGHIALCTGHYEGKTNDGSEYPVYPSLFQQYLSCASVSPTDAWIITSKTKLDILGNCEDLGFRNAFLPSVDAIDRPDRETFLRSIEILDTYQPTLSLIQFKGPDARGHARDWPGYLESIIETDSLLFELIEYVRSHDHFKGTTAVFMTNDHGRHLDGVADGFQSHGDHCQGCTHINFMAYGPDFHKGVVMKESYQLIDILPTVGKILGFESDYSQGRVIRNIFIDYE